MRKHAGLVLALVIILSLGQLAVAQSFPDPQGYVSDFARVLNQSSRAQIEVIADQLKKDQGIELAVVTMQSTAPYDPTEYRTRLFEAWGIGGPEDSGLLILLSLDEGAIEVETGYGLEGVLPDGKVGAYLDQAVENYLSKGQFGPGLSYLAQAFQAELAGEEFEQAKEKSDSGGDWLIAFGIFIILSILMRRGRHFPPGGPGSGGSGRRYRPVIVPTMRVPTSRGGFGGRGGGGFGGFGGGRSGGGGAGRRF